MSVVAGAINSVAGGGTLLTFPTLQFAIGLEPKIANATNTLGLLCASLTGALGFSRGEKPSRKVLLPILCASAAGGITGAELLYGTKSSEFEKLLPWLYFGAATLFIAQDKFAKGAAPAEQSERGVLLPAFFQFFIGLYGGYFGAGIGVLMIVEFSLFKLGDIYKIQFLKNLSALTINSTAAVYFIARGMVVWQIAVAMAFGAALGGWAGAGAAKKIGAKRLRAVVVAIGYSIGAYMLIRQLFRI